jgi:hypothetical protein
VTWVGFFSLKELEILFDYSSEYKPSTSSLSSPLLLLAVLMATV